MRMVSHRATWIGCAAGCVIGSSWLGACSAVDGRGVQRTTDDTAQEPTSSTEEPTTNDTDEPTTGDETTSGDGDEPDPSALGTVGEGCSAEGNHACAGTNQQQRLICAGGKWAELGACPADERCDSRLSNAGECEPVLPACIGLTPGTAIATCDGNQRQVCGPDLVTLDNAAACAHGTGCLGGVCEPTVPGCTAKDAWVCSSDGTERIQCGDNGVEAERESCAEGLSCVDGACGVPSCGGLEATCGADENELCCSTSSVSGGTFLLGAGEGFPALVSDFKLDVYEVTVGRFRRFKTAWDSGERPSAGDGKHVHVRGGGGLMGPAEIGESGWSVHWEDFVDTSDAARGEGDPEATWTSEPDDNENLPINFVNWYEAFAFCIWDHGFLPSEAEWEYAATGGPQPDGERSYPWGNAEPSCSYANYDACDNGLSVVGSRSPQGDGRYGQSDLAGSAYEWVLDYHAETYISPCEDCSNTVEAANRVIRGGYWDLAAKDITAVSRSNTAPSTRSNAIGARCARTP